LSEPVEEGGVKEKGGGGEKKGEKGWGGKKGDKLLPSPYNGLPTNTPCI